MSANRAPGRDAWQEHGFWIAHKWLILRRVAQLGFFLLFASGPWFGYWIVKGTLASSLTLDTLPLNPNAGPLYLSLFGTGLRGGSDTRATIDGVATPVCFPGRSRSSLGSIR